MKNIYTCLHYINIDANVAQRKEINKEDADDYIRQLIREILKNPNRKQYKQKSNKTEVVSIVIESILNKIVNDTNSDLVANRLLNKEIERQKEVDRLEVEIKRGSLVQSMLKDEDCFYYIITKIENVDILDIDHMFKRSGLPYEDKSFKNCLFKLDEDGEIIEIFLSDKNRTIADYWDNLFLELEELTSDETNTLSIFNYLTSKIKREVEKVSPSDYTMYRNQTLGYFKTQDTFNIDDFLQYTFGNHQPESDKVNVDKIKLSISDQMKTKELDTEFNIVPSAIKARRYRETKKVNDFTSITIDGFDEEIKNNIKTKTENGEDYIMIKATEKGTFERFNW